MGYAICHYLYPLKYSPQQNGQGPARANAELLRQHRRRRSTRAPPPRPVLRRGSRCRRCRHALGRRTRFLRTARHAAGWLCGVMSGADDMANSASLGRCRSRASFSSTRPHGHDGSFTGPSARAPPRCYRPRDERSICRCAGRTAHPRPQPRTGPRIRRTRTRARTAAAHSPPPKRPAELAAAPLRRARGLRVRRVRLRLRPRISANNFHHETERGSDRGTHTNQPTDGPPRSSRHFHPTQLV